MSLAESWDELDSELSELSDFDEEGLLGDAVDPSLPDRLLRRIARERRKLAEAEAVAQAERERIEAYLDRSRKAHDTSWLEGQLAGYHEARLARDPRLKTIHLPSGDLVARKAPDRWEFDEDFLVWAKENATELTRVKFEVDRTEAKRRLKVHGSVVVSVHGEAVPGVTVEPGGISFTAKPSEDLS